MKEIHKRETLMNMSKKQLVELIEVLEHNNQALKDHMDIQYRNAMEIFGGIEEFKKRHNSNLKLRSPL
jgi:hypothetical protein